MRKIRQMNQLKLTGAFLLACGVLSAQDSAMPIYRVSVTSRTIKAVSYQHRSGATKIDFQERIYFRRRAAWRA